MKPLKGLYTDVQSINQPEGTYPFAKNLVNTGDLNALQNEKGFFKYNSVVPGNKILHIMPMGPQFLVFSLTTGAGVGHIGYVTINGLNLTYTSVYSSATLNFNPDIAIKAEYNTNAKGERIVAWIEINGVNVPRIINIDNPSLTTIDDADLFPKYNFATAETSVLDSGGALLSATYIPMYKYKRDDIGETDWIVCPVPGYVVNEANSSSVDAIDGAPAGTPTSKAIRIVLTQTDLRFDRIVFGYIRTKGGITQAYRITEVANSTGVTYNITGNEMATDVSLDEILTPNANYRTAQAITQLNNQLILGNLTSDDVLDLQPIANRVRIDYTYVESDPSTTSNLKSGTQLGTFQPGEVYAFYLVVELDKGGQLAYHIPGRGPAAGETDTTTSDVAGITAKKFQVADTSAASGRVNRMAYWENASEKYPENFPVGLSATGSDTPLANQFVRHHKFPDTNTLLSRHGNLDGSNSKDGTTIPQCQISVSNVIIPSELQGKIRGWKIAYAKRTYQNSLVIGSDLLHLAASYSENPDIIWTTGGNWNIEARRGDGDGAWQDMTVWHYDDNSTITKVQRGHCLDLLHDKPGVLPGYVEFAYKLKAGNLNEPYSGHNNRGGWLNTSGEGAGQAPGAVINFSKPTARKSLLTGTRKKRVTNFQYIPQNSIVGNISTKKAEEIVYMEIDDLKNTIESHGSTGLLDYPSTNTPDIPLVNTRSSGASPAALFNSPVADCDYESTYYTYYKQVLGDVYVSYTNQPLVMTNKRAAVNTTLLANIEGGDVRTCLMSYMTTSVQSPTVQDSENSHIEGPRMFKMYLGEARHNWNFRHQGSATAVEDWYAPKTDPRDFWNPRATTSSGTSLIDTVSMKLNKLSYNTDYDLVNEFLPAVIVDDIENFSTSAPTAIIYSPIQNPDSLESSWGTFPANHRYVQPKNRGPITNLQGYKNKDLIIHHRDSLYITRSNLSLNTDSQDVKLASAFLFDLAPEEVLSTEQGYAGTRHPMACKLTKLGYVFPSDLQGKIFAYDGQLKELSAMGMRQFFRDNGESDGGLIENETIVTGDLITNPAFGANASAWEQHGQVYETDWNFDGNGARITALNPTQGLLMKNAVQEVEFIPGTTIDLTLTANVTTGFYSLITFTAVFLDSNNAVLGTRTIGSNSGYWGSPKTYTLNNVAIPANATKVGFKMSAGTFSGTGELIVTNFKVVGSKIFTSTIETEIMSNGYQISYDEYYNRLLVSKTSSERSWTLSYNPANELWTSFHSYLCNHLTNIQNDKLISAKGTDLYLHNAGPYGVYYDDMETQSWLLDVVLNPSPEQDKVLSTVGWQTRVEDSTGGVLWDKTIDYISFTSDFKCSGNKPITKVTGFNSIHSANTRPYNGSWYFNDVYDISLGVPARKDWTQDFEIDPAKLNSNSPWYGKRKFIDKYVICRLKYANSDNHKFSLLDFTGEFRPSFR